MYATSIKVYFQFRWGMWMSGLLWMLGSLLISMSAFSAEKSPDSNLSELIMAQDRLLFDVGFNQCKIEEVQNLFSADFEFFHDKDGISNKSEFVKGMRNGLCSSPSTFRSRRELTPGTTEIYPLFKNNKLYGAVQNGDHRFYESIKGAEEKLVGKAKFTNLWILENQVWKLKNSLSFDHKAADATDTSSSIFDDEKAVEKWMVEKNIPTLGVGVISEGKLQQVKVYGKIKEGVAAPYNTIFNVASLTKPITTLVTLKLVSQGRWNLDEPLYKQWLDPDLGNDPRAKKITTRHVLSHQTGFPNWRGNKKLAFEFDPSKRFQYSGEGFEYLRRALEKKFGKTLDKLAEELIFKPLEMNDSEFFWGKKTDADRYANNYAVDGKIYPKAMNKQANAADNLLTTVRDYGEFVMSVMKGSGLSSNVVKQMSTPQVSVKQNKHFGLGFEIFDLGNDEIALSHSGGDEGVQTLAVFLPKTKQGLVIFTNIDDGYKVYEDLLGHYLGNSGKKIFAIESAN